MLKLILSIKLSTSMKKFLTLSIVLILTSCSAPKKVTGLKKCNSLNRTGYDSFIIEKFKSKVNNSTILVNELKYECVNTAMLTKKIMYDTFGKWDKEIYPKRKSHPILVWENIKLFYNDTVKFTVATNGIESYKYINASVLVFDKEYKDALAKVSKYKSKLISYFSDMIHSNNTKKKDFYEIYWKTVSPEHWKRINTN